MADRADLPRSGQTDSRFSTSRTVTAVIPTLNAARTLRACLQSVQGQIGPAVEIVVVDAESSDRTATIASDFGQVIVMKSTIPEARLIGAQRARGDYILNLDADQSLQPDAVARALATRAPIVSFGEDGVGGGIVGLVNRLDLAATQASWERNIDPFRGQIRPRFYERELLIRALEAIPPPLMRIKPAPHSEDSLIFINALRLDHRLAFVPHGIKHDLSLGLSEYMRKWQRYGRAARAYRGTSYETLATGRGYRNWRSFRSVVSLPALVIKGVPFMLGYRA